MQYPRGLVRTRLLRWAPAVIYMALIFYSSSQSDPAPALTQHVWDKLLHASGYGVLALLYWWALGGETLTLRATALAAILLASAYAASDEVHQLFTPGRNADVNDWMADTLGAALAIAGAAISTALRRPRRLRP
jgi:VanZ family protein